MLFFTTLFGGGLVPNYIINAGLLHLDNTIWIYILPGVVNGWNVIVIKTVHILMVFAILIGIALVILAGKLLYDNYYLIRHDIKVKQERKDRFRPISNRKKKWKKRDRMFK